MSINDANFCDEIWAKKAAIVAAVRAWGYTDDQDFVIRANKDFQISIKLGANCEFKLQYQSNEWHPRGYRKAIGDGDDFTLYQEGGTDFAKDEHIESLYKFLAFLAKEFTYDFCLVLPVWSDENFGDINPEEDLFFELLEVLSVDLNSQCAKEQIGIFAIPGFNKEAN